MAPPAARSPAAPRPSNRRVASCRPSCPESLQPLPFPSPFPAWLGAIQRRLLAGELLLLRGDSRHRLSKRGKAPLPHSYLCSFPNALISTSTPAGRSSFIDRKSTRLN